MWWDLLNLLPFPGSKQSITVSIQGRLSEPYAGNVGVGTTSPFNLFEVGNQQFDVTSGGNVGIGTTIPQEVWAVMSGNVGIGTAGAGGGA